MMIDVGLSRKRLKKAYLQCIKFQALACVLCGRWIEKEEDFSFEHLVPRSRGGADSIGNIFPAHHACNARKENMTLQEFRKGEYRGK